MTMPEDKIVTPAATDVITPEDIQKNKVMAILCYLGLLAIIPFITAKQSPFVKVHLNQGIVLLLVEIALGILMVVFSVVGAIIVAAMPSLGWLFSCFIGLVALVGYLGVIVLAIMGIISAANGQTKPLPVIGKYKLIK